MATALELKFMGDPNVEAKFEALKNMHALKTKSLMGSIDNLNKEVTRLKVLGKDSRRAQMVQALRNKMRDYDLVVDVLKEELRKNTDMDKEEINELIIRKTTGGPKRFRPLTREELEKKIVDLEKDLKKAGKYGSSNRGDENVAPQGQGRGMTRPPSSTLGSTGQLALLRGAGKGGGDPDESAKVAMLTEKVKQMEAQEDIKEGLMANLKDELNRLRTRNAELMTSSETYKLQDRKLEDLENTLQDVSDRLETSTRALAQSREECLLMQEASDADVEMLRKELEQLHGQCEQLLKQNTVLLRQLGEKELDEALSMVRPGVADKENNTSQVEIEKLSKQLADAQDDARDQKTKADRLRGDLREKNEIIRELKRTLAITKTR